MHLIGGPNVTVRLHNQPVYTGTGGAQLKRRDDMAFNVENARAHRERHQHKSERTVADVD